MSNDTLPNPVFSPSDFGVGLGGGDSGSGATTAAPAVSVPVSAPVVKGGDTLATAAQKSAEFNRDNKITPPGEKSIAPTPKTPPPKTQQPPTPTIDSDMELDPHELSDFAKKKMALEEQPEIRPNPPRKMRDPNRFPEELRPHIKSMSNQALDFVEAKMNELTEIKNKYAETEKTLKQLQEAPPPPPKQDGYQLPDSYYENPSAYVLSPEYQQLTEQASKMDFEMNHWQEQLAKCREGEPVSFMIGWRGGEPVYSDPMDASGKVEARLVTMITQNNASRQAVAGQIGYIQNSHITRHKEAVGQVNEFFKKTIPWVQQPELVDKIKVKGQGGVETPLKDVLAEAQQLIPPPFKSHPLAKYCEHMYGIARLYHGLHQEALAKLAQKDGDASKVRDVGPINTTTAATDADGIITEKPANGKRPMGITTTTTLDPSEFSRLR